MPAIPFSRRLQAACALILLLSASSLCAPPPIRISPDTRGFLAGDQPFTPWGFNYDRDFKLRLLEEYWDAEWATVEADFREMKQLGANVVRVHLQFHQFMESPDKPNPENLKRLHRLVRLAEEIGLYLDITGLATYRKPDVPAWYEALDEPQHWQAQANFWEAIAQTCKNSPAVFCYDLVNEPVVPGRKLADHSYIHPANIAGFHYAQYITLDPGGRNVEEIARAWTKQLIAAIRKHDRDRLITIGMLPYEHTGFAADSLASQLDFIAVHIYPDRRQPDEASKTLQRFDAGKPLVIEEIFPIGVNARELADFITRSRAIADGWISFYWGQTPADLADAKTIHAGVTREWLTQFGKINPNRPAVEGSRPGSTQPARP